MSLPNLPDVPRERRRTATVVAVGVFAVLCVLALVLGLKGLFAPADDTSGGAGTASRSSAQQTGAPQSSAPSGASSGSSSGASATSGSPTASTDQPAADVLRFTSPTRNIRCEVSSTGARCDIGDRTWQPPAKPADCQAQWGQGVLVDAHHATMTCAADVLQPAGNALSYGSSVSRGDFRCISSMAGVECTHGPSGHGFTIARESYRLT